MIATVFASAARAAILASLLIAPAVFGGAATATAKTTRTITIGADPVILPAPKDYCFLDAGETRDGQLFAAVQQSIGAANQLFAIFADCTERSAWRKGEALLTRHGQIQTMVKLRDKRMTIPRPTFAQAVCRHATPVRRGAPNPPVPAMGDAELAERINRLPVGRQQFLGAIDVDADACFTGLIQKFRTATGAARPEIAVIATTLVRGKILYVYLYAPASGANALNALLSKAKQLVREIVEANDA
jgi:hypothetical protein